MDPSRDRSKYIHRKLNAAYEAMTGTRFCKCCQRHRPQEGGRYRVDAARARKWECGVCVTNVRPPTPPVLTGGPLTRTVVPAPRDYRRFAIPVGRKA